MQIRDLIKELERILEKEKPNEEIMGEPQICIDLFERSGEDQEFQYKGLLTNRDIKIVFDSSSGYYIMSAFQNEYDEDIKK